MNREELLKFIDSKRTTSKTRLKFLNSVKSALKDETKGRRALTYFLTSEDLITDVVPWITFTHNEVMLYGVGINENALNIRIPTLFIVPAIDNPSPCFVRANAFSSLQNLTYSDFYGLPLVILIHSHPGTGKGATIPSGLDIRTMKVMEKHYPAIGCIFSQDLFFRFFSVASKFEVKIFGKGVNWIEDRLYKVDEAYLHSQRA